MKLLFILLSVLFQPKDSIVDLANQVQKKYNVPNKNYVVIIDFTKSIYEKRLFLVDMKNQKIILKSVVSHAYNSGDEYAKEFSNTINSKKTSLGAFLTKNTYYGYYGYSLIISGLDKELNSNAEKRAIIFHSTKKMTKPWSWGCFSTPDSVNNLLIDKIKNGCLIYAHN
jgi:hypothetical protein